MDKSEKNSTKIKNRRPFKDFLYIGILVVSILLIIVEGIVYYQRSYLTPFWVNGQSMYPTLNGHAKNKNGVEIGDDGGSAREGYTVDYGVMDEHKSALKKIKRFDVVVTLYNEADKSNKIKRVIGLPGETLKFATGDKNGDLSVNGKYIEQPISTEIIRKGNYPTEEIKLGENEYYVMGDNRNHSWDSRLEGPIKKEWITGKAKFICGTATVYTNEKGLLDIKDIKYKWPKKIK